MNLQAPGIRSKPLTFLDRFFKDRSGSVMLTVSMAAPFVIALVGFGLEAGLLYRIKRAEQTAADAAALAGAIERGRGETGAVVTTAARNAATANGFSDGTSTTVTVNSPPMSGLYAGNNAAVEVIITTTQPKIIPLSLTGGTGDGATTITSSSVAMAEMTGDACVLALDASASAAVKNSGNATIGMEGCVVAANSVDPSAISIGGSSTLSAHSLWTAGNYTQGGSSTLNLAAPPMTEMWALSDPYASLTIPSPGSCSFTNKKVNSGAATLSPGTYCKGLDIGAQAVVTLSPGTYYIDGGDLKVNGQATIKCPSCTGTSGVTFVLTSSGSADDIGIADINGGADVKLQAPSDAGNPFAGLLIVQDRKAGSSGVMKLNGGSTQVLNGAIYAPKSEVQWSGTTDTTTNACIEIVARLITFIGNSAIDNSGCSAMGVKPIQITASKLVQ
ncbi:MAG: pilus assembly protein TadG-related protein [Alphaproteobacteria bacterium]|nr:pilus assembly protein TadG-related protein [Alphaproteobacteria bacterium]